MHRAISGKLDRSPAFIVQFDYREDVFMSKWGMVWAAVAAVVLVAGCSRAEGPKEAERYRIIEKSDFPDPASRCLQAQKTRDAYLRDGNSKEYENWQIVAYADC